MKKENKKIAIDVLDILSGIWGRDPKSNFIKEKLRKEIGKTRAVSLSRIPSDRLKGKDVVSSDEARDTVTKVYGWASQRYVINSQPIWMDW